MDKMQFSPGMRCVETDGVQGIWHNPLCDLYFIEVLQSPFNSLYEGFIGWEPHQKITREQVEQIPLMAGHELHGTAAAPL